MPPIQAARHGLLRGLCDACALGEHPRDGRQRARRGTHPDLRELRKVRGGPGAFATGSHAVGRGEAAHRLGERVRGAGGVLIMPKTDIGVPGFIAVLRDTEGNSVALHSPRAG